MTTPRIITWGILGTSKISADMAHAFRGSTTSKLVAIGSRDENKAIEFARDHKINKYFTSYQELILDPDIDAVYIGLPNHLHKEWIIRCAEAGKHILCEKPFVLSKEEAVEALAAVKKHNVFCMEALMYQCHPFIKDLQDVIESKKIGEVKSISAVYTANIADVENKTAGGAIRNLGCYPLSLVRLIAKDEPESMIAQGKLNHDNTSDTISMGVFNFKNGIIATITTSNNQEFWWQFTVFGTKGVVNVVSNPFFPGKHNQLTIKVNDSTETRQYTADNYIYTYQIDCAAEYIRKQMLSPNSSGVTWEHSIGNVDILDKWLKLVKKNSMKIEEILLSD